MTDNDKIICFSCGKENFSYSQYCLNCGWKLQEVENKNFNLSSKQGLETLQKEEAFSKPVSEELIRPEKLIPPDVVEPEPEEKPVRKRQLDWSDIVSFGWLTIIGSIING